MRTPIAASRSYISSSSSKSMSPTARLLLLSGDLSSPKSPEAVSAGPRTNGMAAMGSKVDDDDSKVDDLDASKVDDFAAGAEDDEAPGAGCLGS
eukprot:16442173-Heterocapsa_arctica.AAC.1